MLVEFLSLLAELDRRRTVLALGFPSLLSFCTDHLGLTKAAAFRRTTAARLLARFPLVAEYLTDGRLNLTTLVELRDLLDEPHLVEILDRAAGRTEHQVKELVATLRPRAAPSELLRKLPTVRNHSGGSGPELSVATTTCLAPQPARATGEPLAQLATVAPMAAPALAAFAPPAPTTLPARIEPIAQGRHVLRMTVGAAFIADLDAVREALSHRMPGGALEEVLHECIRVTLRNIERQRQGTGKKTTAKAPPPGSRYVPVAVRDEVWRRDDGRCAFVGSGGHRCNSRHQLELHHLEPFALGGSSSVENLTLRCRAHNLHAAEQDYGRRYIARRIAVARVRGGSALAPTIPGVS